ncbi:MAG TPA: hypothetical protein VN778_01960 [Verrucomicrobiae bacterium]|nr:hypothetical protein [Verrucomicrobiae bacterium]
MSKESPNQGSDTAKQPGHRDFGLFPGEDGQAHSTRPDQWDTTSPSEMFDLGLPFTNTGLPSVLGAQSRAAPPKPDTKFDQQRYVSEAE